MNIKNKITDINKKIPAVFLALKNKNTPWYAKMMAWLTIAYALSPVDLIPDFIPVLGYLDDIIILPVLVSITIKLIPEEIWSESLTQAENLWENGKPKKWYYAIPIILFWLIIIFIIVCLVKDKYTMQ